MKKLLTLFALMLVCIGQVFAYDFEVEGIYYTYCGEGVEVASGDPNNEVPSYSGDVEIPSEVWGYTVVGIGWKAFSGCSGLTSITIPSSVTSIDGWAFNGCSGLTSVTIPSSVTSIGSRAFYGCSGLTSINIPDGVTRIRDHTFSSCTSLTSIDIPNSVTSIEQCAFMGSGLTSITIPNSVVTPDAYSGLQEACLYEAFANCRNLSSVTIGSGITNIEPYAFEGCTSLVSIDIPEGVTTIKGLVFDGCTNLKNITLPESLTEIGFGAFSGCNSLYNITSKATVPPSLGSNVFSYYGTLYVRPESKANYAEKDYWKEFTIIGNTFEPGQTVCEIDGLTYNLSGDEATIVDLDYSGNEDIIIPSTIIYEGNTYSVTSMKRSGIIGMDYDAQINAVSVSIPNSMKSIGDYAFSIGIKIASLIIPSSVTSISDRAFVNIQPVDVLESITVEEDNPRYDSRENCNAIIDKQNSTLVVGCKNTVIPNNVTHIGDNAFVCCKGLTSITIPDGVTSIGVCAFYRCTGLTSITIPNSVTSIGSSAFYGCSGLTSVTCLATTPPTINEADMNLPANAVLYVPEESASAYKASEWGNLFSYIYSEPLDVMGAEASTPMTYDEFIALAGTGKRFGLMAVSAANETYHKWFGFTSATSRVATLTNKQLFTLTGTTGNYTITRMANGEEILSGVKCVNRAGSDYAAEYTPEMQISFDNASNLHFNADKYQFYSGAGGWSAYVAYGPFYVATIEIVDEDGNVLQPATKQIVPEGYAPTVEFRELLEGSPVNADGVYTFKFTKEIETLRSRKELDELIPVAKAEYLAGFNKFTTEGLITEASQFSSPFSQNDHGAIDGGNLSDGVLIDGDSNTYWHTSWEAVVPNHTHYLQVAFEEPISGGVQLSMTRRSSAINDHITLIGVWASNEADGEYVEIGSVSTPYSSRTETKKGAFALMQPYRYLRFYIDGTDIERGFGHMSEFQLYKASTESLNEAHSGVANALAKAIVTAQSLEQPTSSDVAALQEAIDFYLANINRDYQTFADGTTYNNTEETQAEVLAYTRNFKNTNWQALYIPFSLDYEEWRDDFDIAEIHNFIEYDDDENGEFDRTYLVVLRKNSGSTEPNYPYLIRAKETGNKTLTLVNKTLEAAESTSIDCSSVKNRYTFTGTYTPVTDMYANGYYALSGGALNKANSASVVLGAQRWYMEVTSRTGGAASVKAQSIKIVVDGEDETEGIKTPSISPVGGELLSPHPSNSPKGESPVAYDLMGRAVRTAANVRGINISNGKKIIN